MQQWLEPLAGGMLLAITLMDVVLTVLYARAGSGLLAPMLARRVWQVLRLLSGRRNVRLMDYGGPAQLVLLTVLWGVLLAIGAALVIHPALGKGVQSGSGSTDSDFMTALLVGGSSMSIVGSSDYRPVSSGFKLLFLFNSLVGLSVTSLTISYVMQVYTAVRRRNTLALMIHAQSGETGDAAELLSRWGPRGRFDGGYSNLSTLADEMAAIKEAHHFYSVLFYFRFEDAFYAPSRLLLVALDASALVRTALDPRELGWLQESAALAELERSSALLLRTLHQSFPAPRDGPPGGARSHGRSSKRYAQALVRLRDAGIPTRADEDAGAREYVASRATWQPGIETLAQSHRWRMEKVDVAGSRDGASATAMSYGVGD